MKRMTLISLVVIAVGGAVVFSGGRTRGVLTTFFPKEERNPVTHLRWNDSPEEFRFAIVSDRTGGHRAEVFSQAVAKLNLLQPEFVVSVGDLIEGGKKTDEKLAAEWKEFDGFVNKLTMPFFYVPGNHDITTKEADKIWESKLGRRHYHFVYRNVLFLVLNSNDTPGTAAIGKDQIDYVQKTLKANAVARWTIVLLHHPLWNSSNGTKNGFADVEKLLNGRQYTVFCGHVHRFEKWVRQGMNYYQLATTGGVSKMRGVDYAEFDHIAWVTMKSDGPVIANILLDSIHNESMTREKTVESGVSTAKRQATHPVRGTAFFEGAPMAGAVVSFASEKGKPGVNCNGVVEADGSFRVSTYKAFDGAAAGDYKITVTWREVKGGPNLAPARYASAEKSGLTATVVVGENKVALELKK